MVKFKAIDKATDLFVPGGENEKVRVRWYMMNTSVIHFFAEQLFYGENHNKNFRLCTFLYISENFMKKFGQKI